MGLENKRPCKVVTVRKAIIAARDQLALVTDVPALEAELLVSFVLHQSRSHVYAWPEKLLTIAQCNALSALITRRLEKEPMAYILGKREFWSLELAVSPETLVPRPETELLVETALSLFQQDNRAVRAADLGTGSGAIAIALAHERPSWQIFATEMSREALAVAQCNAKKMGAKGISFYWGNWCKALPCVDFDVIISNPPYLAQKEWEANKEALWWEPREALVAGEEGLSALRHICKTGLAYLRPGGRLVLEHGHRQGAFVRRWLEEEGFREVSSVLDLASNERMTIGTV